MFERVYTVTVWYDGPRIGVADFEGRPHRFESTFADIDSDAEDQFLLWPITDLRTQINAEGLGETRVRRVGNRRDRQWTRELARPLAARVTAARAVPRSHHALESRTKPSSCLSSSTSRLLQRARVGLNARPSSSRNRPISSP